MQLLDFIISNGGIVDVMLLLMGIPVAAVARINYKNNRILADKYNQIDKLTLLNSFLISDIIGKKVVKVHRNGDYEIINPLNEKND